MSNLGAKGQWITDVLVGHSTYNRKTFRNDRESVIRATCLRTHGLVTSEDNIGKHVRGKQLVRDAFVTNVCARCVLHIENKPAKPRAMRGC